jgi:hypothetical protein
MTLLARLCHTLPASSAPMRQAIVSSDVQNRRQPSSPCSHALRCFRQQRTFRRSGGMTASYHSPLRSRNSFETLITPTTIEVMPMVMQSAEFGPAMIQPTPAPINPREMMYASIVSLIPLIPSPRTLTSTVLTGRGVAPDQSAATLASQDLPTVSDQLMSGCRCCLGSTAASSKTRQRCWRCPFCARKSAGPKPAFA